MPLQSHSQLLVALIILYYAAIYMPLLKALKASQVVFSKGCNHFSSLNSISARCTMGDSTSPNIKTVDLLNLDRVRGSLVRQEETIIFALIERAAFRRNLSIYTDKTLRLHRLGADAIFDRDATFLEYVLCQTEKVHASVRRYMSQEELPFFPGFLPPPILPPLEFPDILAPNDVNINDILLKRYPSEIIPAICESGDDEQHGSSVLCDINVLQALSRRVHFGKFVAESKYRGDTTLYQSLCGSGNATGVNDLLTNVEVEKQVIGRAFKKAMAYAQEIEMNESENRLFKVQPTAIRDIYRHIIIPLTKEVEIRYLFQRTGYPCPSLEHINRTK